MLRFHFEHVEHQYLVTRALVRFVLSQYDDSTPPDVWKFTQNQFKKPSICDHRLADQLYFNLSHTKGMIIMAVASQTVIGADVELIKHFSDMDKVASRHFTTNEMTDYFQQNKLEQAAYFYDLWTLKESYIKAHGQDLSIPLDHFEFSFNHSGQIKINFQKSLTDNPNHWQFWQFNPNERHKIAVAFKYPSAETVHQINCFETVPFGDIKPMNMNPIRQSHHIRPLPLIIGQIFWILF